MTKLVEQDANRTIEQENIVPPPIYQGHVRPQIVTADTARQGPLGKPVLWVLVGVGLMGAYYFAGAPLAP